MGRMKTFRTYLILFLLFYVFVSFMSYGFIKSTLIDMTGYEINVENPRVEILEAKSSRVSGYVKVNMWIYRICNQEMRKTLIQNLTQKI